jgi:putative salt-induced outer membrane protein
MRRDMLMKYHSLLALAFAAHGSVFAADPPPEPGNWSTAAELGAITTSGNTVGTSITGKIDARQELDDWSNEYILSGFFKEDETRIDGEKEVVRSAERFEASAKAAYKVLGTDKKLYVVGSHVNDKFGVFKRYSSLSVGHGKRYTSGKDKTLDVELGPGYFSGVRPTGESENGMTIRGAAALRWRLSPSALFSQSVVMERGTSNLHSVAETSLSTKINGTMQMKAAFSARNDTNVPEDKRNTDTQTSLTLVYAF